MGGITLPVDVDRYGAGRDATRGFTADEAWAAIAIVWGMFLILGPVGAGLGGDLQSWLRGEPPKSFVGVATATFIVGGVVSFLVALVVAAPLVLALDRLLPRAVGLRSRAAAQVALASLLGVGVVTVLTDGTWSSGMVAILPAGTAPAALGWWLVGRRAERRRAAAGSR